LQVIRGGIRPGAAAAHHSGQRLIGVIAVPEQGMMPKPLKFGSASSLSECAGVTVASSRIQVTPFRTLSAIRTPGRAPWRASVAAQAWRRAPLAGAAPDRGGGITAGG